MKLGIIARSDNTGLGNQTKELVDMLKPDKVLLIDSAPFNNNQQFPERYDGYEVIHSHGFIQDKVARRFMSGLDVVLSCETFYNNHFVAIARQLNVKTVLQYNYEFLDYLQQKTLVEPPDILLAPSEWNIDHVIDKFRKTNTQIHLLPPPTNFERFKKVREHNLSNKHNRVLHVAGKVAVNDRNGTMAVLSMLDHSVLDYEVVITTQTRLPNVSNPRVTIQHENVYNKEDLYNEFDAIVLPRRYGGLCLPMNEGLVAGLPVFMTDITPNNQILPDKWLTAAHHAGTFMTRTELNYFSADPKELALMLDMYMGVANMTREKNEAVQIASRFDPNFLKYKYLEVLSN
jgi:glycosyltransferase involved in cell wall biosynthesis